MPALKLRVSSPQTSVAAEEPSLRLATEADVAGASEVARMQSFIAAEFAAPVGPRPWPRMITVPMTIGVSAGLWWGIIAGARALLQA
jgi:hypothetical protein